MKRLREDEEEDKKELYEATVAKRARCEITPLSSRKVVDYYDLAAKWNGVCIDQTSQRRTQFFNDLSRVFALIGSSHYAI